MDQNNGVVVSKQRIHRSEEEILKHLSDQEESGFTPKEYAEMCDINEATFNSWIKKYRKSEEEPKVRLSEGQGFTSIEIIPSKTGPALFAEVNGIKLYREVSAEYLKSLVL